MAVAGEGDRAPRKSVGAPLGSGLAIRPPLAASPRCYHDHPALACCLDFLSKSLEKLVFSATEGLEPLISPLRANPPPLSMFAEVATDQP